VASFLQFFQPDISVRSSSPHYAPHIPISPIDFDMIITFSEQYTLLTFSLRDHLQTPVTLLPWVLLNFTTCITTKLLYISAHVLFCISHIMPINSGYFIIRD